MAPILEVTELRSSYGATPILRGVSLAVADWAPVGV